MPIATILTLLGTLTQIATQEIQNGDVDKVKSLLHVMHILHAKTEPVADCK